MSVAWVFPGQGSQKLGMADSVASIQGASERFQLASEVLGRNLLAICQGTSEESDGLNDLNDTRNTQPAMFVIQSILVDDLKRQGRKPSLLAGHSLGEFSALYASEVIDFETTLRLLKCRSELMADAGGGAMTAVMGFDSQQLFQVVASTEGVVVANDNSNDQVVLSGTPDSVKSVVEKIEPKRAVPLKVSGAFHSPFMANAAKSFANELQKVSFKDAIFSVSSNVDPSPSKDGALLKKRLENQMITGVRWRETMQVIQNQGVLTFVEIGPGKVLSGLAKRSLNGMVINQISSDSDLGH